MPPAKLCDKAIVQCDIDRYRRDQLHQRYVRPPESAQQRIVEIKEERCGQTDENDHTPVCKILRYDLPRPCSGTTTRASPCEPTPTPLGRCSKRPQRKWAASWHRSDKNLHTSGSIGAEVTSAPMLFHPFRAFRHVGQGVGQNLPHTLTYKVCGVYITKKHRKPKFSVLFGAGGVTRTPDLWLFVRIYNKRHALFKNDQISVSFRKYAAS